MLGKIEGGRRRGRQRMRWLDGITDSMDMGLSKESNTTWGRKESDTTEQLNNSNLTFKFHLYLQKEIFSLGAGHRFFFFSSAY